MEKTNLVKNNDYNDHTPLKAFIYKGLRVIDEVLR